MKKVLKVALLVIIIVLIIFFFFLQKENPSPVAHTNTIDQHLSTYLDTHITLTAQATDPHFKNLAFAVPEHNQYNFSQLATAVRAVKYVLKYFSFKTETDEYGTWLWTPIPEITPTYAKNILDQAQRNHINALYLSLDSYLDIFALPDSPAKTSREKAFAATLDNFIGEAHKRGIAVDAEGGWRNWAEPGNEYKALTVVRFVKIFNASHTNTFRGFQYDVEPYLLEKYKTAPEDVLENFVALVDKTEAFIGADPLRFTVVVPAFYDAEDKLTPAISYNGTEASVFEHLLTILDRRDESSVIVMSYRNFAKGSDGSIEISSNELTTATKGFHDTKVILAQETGNFSPSYITFYDTNMKYFGEQTTALSTAFNNNLNFGGLAIHYANSFAALK